MKEYDAKVRLNEDDGGKTGELDIMLKPPFDKGYFKGVTFGITFKDHVFEAEKSGWIPCSERLPEHGGYFLITNIDELVRVDFFRKSTNDFDNYSAIAWMELPKPYEMGE